MSRQHAAYMVALLLALAVAWLLRPTAGPAKLEQLLAECTQPGLGHARLYRGQGHATGSHWYTITLDPPGREPERSLYHSYMRPAFTALHCGDGLVATGERDSVALTPGEARELYDTGTRVVLRGEVVPTGSVNSWFADFKRAMAAVLAATALAVAWYGWRAGRRREGRP